jgi:hypothetical protein
MQRRSEAISTPVVLDLARQLIGRRSVSRHPDKGAAKRVDVVYIRGKQYQANLCFPADVLGPFLQMLIAGRYRRKSRLESCRKKDMQK